MHSDMALEEEDLAGDPGSGIRCFLEKCHIENMYADANSPLFHVRRQP